MGGAGIFSRPGSSRVSESNFHPDPFVYGNGNGGWEGHAASGQPGQPARRSASPAAQHHAVPLSTLFPTRKPPQAVAGRPRRKHSNIVGGSGEGLRREYGIGQAGTPHLNATQKEALGHTSFLKRFFGYDDSQVTHSV